MIITEMYVEWIYQAQGKFYSQAVQKMEMKLRVPQKAQNFLTRWKKFTVSAEEEIIHEVLKQ